MGGEHRHIQASDAYTLSAKLVPLVCQAYRHIKQNLSHVVLGLLEDCTSAGGPIDRIPQARRAPPYAANTTIWPRFSI